MVHINDKAKPTTPEKRRNTAKYADAVGAGRENELANIIGQIICEAGEMIGQQTVSYKKQWRTDDASSVAVVRDVAEQALGRDGSHYYDESLNRQTYDQYRDMRGRYTRMLTEGGLLDGREANAMVADIVHNQLCAKEEELAKRKPTVRGG